MGSIVNPKPVESHNSVGKVEKYHVPLRRAFKIIRSETEGLLRDEQLQIAVKVVNDTAGPNELVPMLLVFGVYLRMTERNALSPIVAERGRAVRKAMDEVRKCHALCKISDALNTRNGPNTLHVYDLPLNVEVMVWRDNKGWQGLFIMLGMDRESCLIGFPDGLARIFRSTRIKVFLWDDRELTSLKAPNESEGRGSRKATKQANLSDTSEPRNTSKLPPEVIDLTKEDSPEDTPARNTRSRAQLKALRVQFKDQMMTDLGLDLMNWKLEGDDVMDEYFFQAWLMELDGLDPENLNLDDLSKDEYKEILESLCKRHRGTYDAWLMEKEKKDTQLSIDLRA